jgi:hypothetical protein
MLDLSKDHGEPPNSRPFLLDPATGQPARAASVADSRN